MVSTKISLKKKKLRSGTVLDSRSQNTDLTLIHFLLQGKYSIKTVQTAVDRSRGVIQKKIHPSAE